jgi:acyl-CoA dehydrogenase
MGSPKKSDGIPTDLPDELMPFTGRLSPRFFEARKKVLDLLSECSKVKNREDFKRVQQFAKDNGLWNFFLPEVSGLSVLEYAPIAELLGKNQLANVAMNCSAPDTGNMEVLEKFGNAEQKKQWLEPLLNQEIRSAFAMTEPAVASSDATNISSTIERVPRLDGKGGEEYLVNGHKWYISGACRDSCKVFIFLGKTKTKGPLHGQQSMLIIPKDLPGIRIVRSMDVFGHSGDHAEIFFHDVRVPLENIILGEGRGFEIAQGRLGPGRIHHCMRTLGQAEDAMESILYRARNRTAFGKKLVEKDTILQCLAEAKLELTRSRMLCYLAAVVADEKGFKDAKQYIAMIKVDAPRTALKIFDDAIQVHGAHGVSQDSHLSTTYTHLRTLRVADGPDIVHMNTIAKELLSKTPSPEAIRLSGTNKNIELYHKEKDEYRQQAASKL